MLNIIKSDWRIVHLLEPDVYHDEEMSAIKDGAEGSLNSWLIISSYSCCFRLGIMLC